MLLNHTPREEVKGMKELIQRLNEKKSPTTDNEQKSKPKLKANLLNSVSKDAPGMYDILQRLDEATTKVAEEAVEEAYDDPMMAVATKKEIVLRLQNMKLLWTNNRLFRHQKRHFTPLMKMVKYCTNKLHYLKRQWE